MTKEQVKQFFIVEWQNSIFSSLYDVTLFRRGWLAFLVGMAIMSCCRLFTKQPTVMDGIGIVLVFVGVLSINAVLWSFLLWRMFVTIRRIYRSVRYDK